MLYAVAHFNFFDNDLQLTSIEADDPITALIEGVRSLCPSSDDVNKWLDPMLKNIPTPEDYAGRIAEIQTEFFDADQVVAVMPFDSPTLS